MKKICLFLSVLTCIFFTSYSYAQPGPNYDAGDSNCDQPCAPPERPMNDCYCLYCRYEPCYYNKWHCQYCPKYTYKKCCRYVPQYYQKQCCRYVPQYYCQTCCRYVPQYYYTCQCHYVPKYSCERCCRYVPKYYYKHVCQPTCTPDSCAEAPRY